MDTKVQEAELIIGTYEDYVLGYRVETIPAARTDCKRKKLKTHHAGEDIVAGSEKQSKIDHCSLEQSFAVRGHSGSVKSLASNANGSLIFSAGHDEMLNLFNLKKRKLVQTLEGAATSATFVGSSHLLCGSTDGNIYIYECKGANITRVKTLKGHKAEVISLDAHPSGKVLLSLSADNTMRTWNLIKGRCAFVTQTRPDAHMVKWSKSGDEFVLTANNEIYLYDNTGSLKHTIKLEKRINAIEFITDDNVVVASDCGKLYFFDLKKNASTPHINLDAHSSRIKAISCFSLDKKHSKFNKGTGLQNYQLASASSDGAIKLWSIAVESDALVAVPTELARVELGARLTCMVVAIR